MAYATVVGLPVAVGLSIATATLTALVGVALGLAAVLRLGFVADFISAPVLTGFKAGIGLVIVLDQIPKLLGLHIAKRGFFQDALSLVQHVPEASLLTVAVGLATLAVLVGLDRLRPHSPAPLVAVGGAIAASWYFGLSELGVSAVGAVPRGVPPLTLPDLALCGSSFPARSESR